MSTAALLLLACLAAKPTECRMFEVPVDSCQLPFPRMQAALVWTAQHPGWRLQRTEGCVEGDPA